MVTIAPTSSSTRGNTTLIVAYLQEATLHTYHVLQLQSLVSRVSDIVRPSPLSQHFQISENTIEFCSNTPIEHTLVHKIL